MRPIVVPRILSGNHFEIILVHAGHKGAWLAPDIIRQRQKGTAKVFIYFLILHYL